MATTADEQSYTYVRPSALTFAEGRADLLLATSGGRTQSFKAQLVIPDRNSMELIAYTPVGTTAATIRATGGQISFVNHVENSAWEGTPEDLARTLSIYSTSILPAEMAMLLIGLPVIDDAAYTATASGLQTASTGDVFVTFAPPQFPARNVTVRRGNDVVVIEHLEVVSSQ